MLTSIISSFHIFFFILLPEKLPFHRTLYALRSTLNRPSLFVCVCLLRGNFLKMVIIIHNSDYHNRYSKYDRVVVTEGGGKLILEIETLHFEKIDFDPELR